MDGQVCAHVDPVDVATPSPFLPLTFPGRADHKEQGPSSSGYGPEAFGSPSSPPLQGRVGERAMR